MTTAVTLTPMTVVMFASFEATGFTAKSRKTRMKKVSYQGAKKLSKKLHKVLFTSRQKE